MPIPRVGWDVRYRAVSADGRGLVWGTAAWVVLEGLFLVRFSAGRLQFRVVF